MMNTKCLNEKVEKLEVRDLRDDEVICKVSEKLYEIFKREKSRQNIPSPFRYAMSIRAEIKAMHDLDAKGYKFQRPYGLVERVESFNKNKPIYNNQPDIVARKEEADKGLKFEVKCGQTHYKVRQFTEYHAKKYKREGVDYVIWVDVLGGGCEYSVYRYLTPKQILTLPKRKNVYGDTCYELTDSEGNDHI